MSNKDLKNVNANQDSNDYLWQPHPAPAKWLDEILADFCEANPDIAWLGERMLLDTGTRLVDWLDHLAMLPSKLERRKLKELGYESDPACDPGNDATEVLVHRRGMFPPILVLAEASEHQRSPPLMPAFHLGVRVDSVDDFLEAHRLTCLNLAEAKTEGQYRYACISRVGGVALYVVERHGWRNFCRPSDRTEQIAAGVHHLREFRQRKREISPDNGSHDFASAESAGFDEAELLIGNALEDVGVDWACALFFQAEREYWQSRNHAARVQYGRQSKLGLGWANHDHHTYRSSREGFHRLIHCLEMLGLECRERFYAGEQAGWGAQVLEQPNCRIVIFADVDLAPHEITGDIAHEPLPPRPQLGTVGTWCRLQGESFLAAGMHHLECQFDFDVARKQLAEVGVETMAPFTNFPHLRQAFTVGEKWRIGNARLERALAEQIIDEVQATRFRVEGVLGSHLEILERNDGYKGFNQTGISDIILRTDPRS